MPMDTMAEYITRQVRWMVGRTFIWEPKSIRERARVESVTVNDDGEVWVCTSATDRRGELAWNELSRFLEAISTDEG